ncbi:PEK protein kinase [Plasmodium falciparum FCH/4]|uniref:Eukaryotic translation initiation factor 2-alpha kinase PK4 n=1 Tax=Plasmodium falciparum FCH/4 TaxID=1036724 RepID=A0A024VS90_PLAFA|nr:PEK protein kinase [Plasmodium falciparum FCH/4]
MDNFEQPTLVDILARHARDSTHNDGVSYYPFNENETYNMLSLNYAWGGNHKHMNVERTSEYNMGNISHQLNYNNIRNLGDNKISAYELDIYEKELFHLYRRRAASQDVLNKKSFVMKKRIRSSYKVGSSNKYHKKNYTDNEKDKKKYRSYKEKHINEKMFDKKEFLNFLTNFNKKFMKKNSLVDHLIKMNDKAEDNYDGYNSSGSRYNNINDDGVELCGTKRYTNNKNNSDYDNYNNNNNMKNKRYSNKKHNNDNIIINNNNNKYTDERKYRNKSIKEDVDYTNDYYNIQLNNNKINNNQTKNKIDTIRNISHEKLGNNKSSSARNLSLIQTSHIPYDAPLADFLENGRFLRTFENISLIGQGGFGSVYKVSHRLEPGSPTYAVKFIYLKVSSLDNVSSRRYFREIAANRDIYSKHVVRYYTWWCEEPQFLPMHLMPKEIQNLVKKNKDTFKKRLTKNKKYSNNCISDSSNNNNSSCYSASSYNSSINSNYRNMKLWIKKKEQSPDMKRYKEVLRKNNAPNLVFYSDNDGLTSKNKENPEKNHNPFLSDKNFSDSIYKKKKSHDYNSSSHKLKKRKNKKKKSKKKRKSKSKIKTNAQGIYEESENDEGRDHFQYKKGKEQFSKFIGKHNSMGFTQSFQEYDPFDNGYLSEEDRDLIVFADNEESNGNDQQMIRHDNMNNENVIIKHRNEDDKNGLDGDKNGLDGDKNGLDGDKNELDDNTKKLDDLLMKQKINSLTRNDIVNIENENPAPHATNNIKNKKVDLNGELTYYDYVGKNEVIPNSRTETNVESINTNGMFNNKFSVMKDEGGEYKKKENMTWGDTKRDGLYENGKHEKDGLGVNKCITNKYIENDDDDDDDDDNNNNNIDERKKDLKKKQKNAITKGNEDLLATNGTNNKEKRKKDDDINKNMEKIKSYKKKTPVPEFSIVLLLQMELCKGYTLRKWLDRSTRSDKPLHFTYSDKKMNHPLEFDLFKQLIKGLKDIHATCFIHRDLKPENIFVDPDTYTLKIGDLGLVRFIEEKKREKDFNNIDCYKDNIYTDINQNAITSQISIKGQIIGTPGYTAPEGGALCDEKADIYSAALILLELLCPRFTTIMERYKRLNDFRNYYTVPDYVKIHLNPWYILMLQMSKPNPADRPSAADVYSKIKVLLDPHLTDFAFSFNDIHNEHMNKPPQGTNNFERITDNKDKFVIQSVVDMKNKVENEEIPIEKGLNSNVENIKNENNGADK